MAIQKQCPVMGKSFSVTDADLEFYQKISPSFDGRTFEIPAPTYCPEERFRRRLAFRNLRSLYKRNCDLTGKSMITIYSPEMPIKVYNNEVWWGDGWDALAYGTDFDFNRPFFPQFKELLWRVPVPARFAYLNENCDFINGAANCRDCYLAFNMDYCEHCLYLTNAKHCDTCVDCLNLLRCQFCYECIDCENCYALFFSSRCIGCSESLFLADCRQCKNCIGCNNLTNKENYLFNQKVSAEEIKAAKEKLRTIQQLNSFKGQFREYSLGFPRKYYIGHSNEDFSGDNIQHIKNSFECYESFEIENCRYCYYVFESNNCMDLSIFGDHSQWIYQCVATGINCSHALFCVGAWMGSSHNLYSQFIIGSTNNFGCVGLQKKQYCIFNKQYTKEEYGQLAAKIATHMQKTGEWGEFFPPDLAPYGFNETLGQTYFPLKKSEALRLGYVWKDIPEPAKNSQTYMVPTLITYVEDQILKELLACRDCGRNFKVILQELQFYRKENLPIPEVCPECRHAKRLEMSNPYRLWKRNCGKCNQSIESSYEPSRPEKVYCEECYRAEVY